LDSADQVVFVLQLIIALGPLAVYFLGLGLVNSQAHPCLVRARSDFVLLAIAFVPVIVAPILLLVQNGHPIIALAVVAAVAGLFAMLLPRSNGNWVVYNIGITQCRRVLERSCRRLGWSLSVSDDTIEIAPAGLTIHQSSIPWLRNVSIRVQGSEQSADRLMDALGCELQRESMLPSPTGASLVVIGAALLGVPMYYLLNHMNAIVDVVKHILFA
jgi:hypothetical protein